MKLQKMRSLIGLIWTTFLFVIGVRTISWAETERTVNPSRPNIVLIMADDLAWSDLGCYGSRFNLTPNIDRLAAEGVRFTSAYAASPVCSPSRAAVMTGKNPARLHFTHIIESGISSNEYWRSPILRNYLPLNETTIAKALKKNGYVTAHIGKWHIGGYGDAPEGTGDPERYGFDVNVAGSSRGQTPDYFYPYITSFQDGRIIFTLPKAPEGKPGDYLDDRLTDEAIKFIKQNKNGPFFLYMSHFLPHTSVGDRLQARKELIDKHRQRLGKDVSDIKVVYAAMVEHLDVNVGRLMKALKEEGILDKTIVFFTSDNGGYGGKTTNLPLRGAKSQVYEGGIRVPFIVYWQGKIKPGSINLTPVIGYDIFPTTMDVVGVDIGSLSDIDGTSLVPLLTGSGNLSRNALYWYFPHFQPGNPAASAIRKGDYKLIEFFDSRTPRLELYNLKNDLGEKNNLIKQAPELAENMHRELKKWKTDIGAQELTPLNPEK